MIKISFVWNDDNWIVNEFIVFVEIIFMYMCDHIDAHLQCIDTCDVFIYYDCHRCPPIANQLSAWICLFCLLFWLDARFHNDANVLEYLWLLSLYLIECMDTMRNLSHNLWFMSKQIKQFKFESNQCVNQSVFDKQTNYYYFVFNGDRRWCAKMARK